MDYNQYNNQPNGQYGYGQPAPQVALADYVSQIMKRVYLRMALALVVTAFAAYFTLVSGLFNYIFQSPTPMFVLMIAEVGLVLFLSARIDKMSGTTSTILFFLYSILNGVTLSLLFVVYTMTSIAQTFFITAGVFGAMTIYGYTTSRDLTKIGTYLVMALIGLIVCVVVNIFLKSSTFDFIISLAGVAIFVGLTAWDTQKIKGWAAATVDQPEMVGRLATMGALSLYLDFVNLFIYLLRIFGRRN